MLNIDAIVNEFTTLTKDTNQYLSSQIQNYHSFKEITKTLYEYDGVQKIFHSEQNVVQCALKKLIKKNFGDQNFDEQIWQLLELQNELLFSNISKNVKSLMKSSELIDFKDDPLNRIEDEIFARNATYEDFFDLPNNKEIQEDKNKLSKFQVSQDSDKEDDDKSPDFSEESGSEQLDDEMYDTRDIEDDEMENLKGSKLKNLMSDNESDSDEDKRNEPQLSDKSTYQKDQEKLKKKIQELENEILSEKPWQLKGEITSNVRPENSLLEEDLLYDHLTRQAPAITEETTLKLEDIIKQRIKDMAWDDVERKHKPVEKQFEYKNALLMEKDKKSLTEVYEQEFIKKQQICENEGKELEEHKQIKNMMQSLFMKIDALSHFQFHPKPPVPDIKIISNIPGINVEEAIPEGISDAALLTPEEIKQKAR